MRGLAISCLGALVAFSGLSTVATPVAAQGSYSPYNETASAALARYVRALAQDPKDFQSLIGAGRAALEIGDSQAAAGFFARADEVDPRSALPQAGMGAVSVANGDAKAAMPYFTRAQQLGATQAVLGCDRGLAYDLLGQQSQAQADYRAALSGPDADDARRRLALSLAVSGDKANALAALAPLAAKGDSQIPRVRAFILALSGDSSGAMKLIDAAMPGGSSSVAPFMQRLSSLSAGQKAAAVNLGIFPDSGDATATYAAARRPPPTTVKIAESVSTDRLAGIDALLGASSSPPSAPTPAVQQQPQARPVQVAYSPEVRQATVQHLGAPVVQHLGATVQPKIWLLLASGSDADALTAKYERLKSENPDLFDGIPGYVVENGDRDRLIVGPFRGESDAGILADDLHSIGVGASRWTNSDSDRIVPLAEE